MADCVIPYNPRKLQQKFHDERTRFCVMICHRRFGKTVAAINDLLMYAFTSGRKQHRAAYIAPYYKQAKRIAWDYLKEFASAITGSNFVESELRCDLCNGARITLYGADNPDALRGIYLDDVVLDEPADMESTVWTQVIRPALTDRKGRALFVGTPSGTENILFDMWEQAGKKALEATGKCDPQFAKGGEWSRFMFRASETGYVDPQELAEARAVMDADEYEQEFQCSFSAAVKGTYYAHLIERAEEDGRICGVGFDSTAPVFAAWDLGMDDSTAIWVAQCVGREVHVIDYFEDNGEGLGHYADWFRGRGYGKVRHFLPHDARARELGTGKSRQEVLESLDIGLIDIVPMQSVEDGINAVRTVIPKCWFDKARCEQGLKALRNYRREWRDKQGVFASRPLHDWTSHAADAFRYLALSIDIMGNRRPVFRPRRRR